MTAEVENYRKTNLVGKVEETYYQVGVLAKILVDANLIDKEEYQERCRQSQMSSIGLKDKGPDAEVEQGDTMIMSYKIYDDSLPATAENPEKVVDDKGNEKLAYVVGSNGLPCDEGMVGMKLGEARYFDVTFGEKSAKKEFVGKNLRMLVMCRGIKIKTGADDQSQVLQSA